MEYWHNHRVMKFFLSCVLVVSGIVSIGGPSEAIAKDYFVAASNGNDANPGTKEAPFLTLEKGASVLLPGDILYVRGGTYRRTHNLWNPPSGTSWTNPVTIKAYQNEQVIVKPLLGTSRNYVFYLSDNKHQYLIMDGLTVDGTEASGAYRMGKGNHHIRISNGEIKNTYASAIQLGEAEYNEFLNLKIHDSWNGVYIKEGSTGTKSYGIYLNGNHNLVKNCEIYNNYGFGINLYSAIGKPSHNRIINNMFYNNDKAGMGIFSGNGNQFINNISWNNERGLQVDYGATNTIVYHNTFYSNKVEEILLGPYSNKSYVKNNLLVGTSSNPVLFAVNGSGASEIENNLIFGTSTDPNTLLKISDANAISSGNLLGRSYSHGLKNPASFDFHLTESSSAIGAGVTLTEVKNDMDGVPRNPTVGFDIGAYQFGGAASVKPPSNLRIANH